MTLTTKEIAYTRDQAAYAHNEIFGNEKDYENLFTHVNNDAAFHLLSHSEKLVLAYLRFDPPHGQFVIALYNKENNIKQRYYVSKVLGYWFLIGINGFANLKMTVDPLYILDSQNKSAYPDLNVNQKKQIELFANYFLISPTDFGDYYYDFKDAYNQADQTKINQLIAKAADDFKVDSSAIQYRLDRLFSPDIVKQ